MPIMIDVGAIAVAEKMIDLASNSNAEVRKKLASILSQVDAGYSDSLIGIISTLLGYRKQGPQVKTTINNLNNKNYQDSLLQMQAFQLLVDGGACKTTSVNTNLFKQLALIIPEYKKDFVSLNDPDFVTALYKQFSEILDRKIHDCKINIEGNKDNKEALTAQRVIQVKKPSHVAVFDLREKAEQYQKQNQTQQVVWLKRSDKGNWQLFALDSRGQSNYLKTNFQFDSLLPKGFPKPGTPLYEKVKMLSDNLLQKSKTSSIYLFNDAAQAKKFAAENPQKQSMLFRSYTPAAPVMGYRIKMLSDLSSTNNNMEQKTIYLQPSGRDIQYFLLSPAGDSATVKSLSEIIKRDQFDNPQSFDKLYKLFGVDYPVSELESWQESFDDLFSNVYDEDIKHWREDFDSLYTNLYESTSKKEVDNTPVDLQSWQEQLVKITAKNNHTETKPDSCQFSWFDTAGGITNIDLPFSNKTLKDNKLPPADTLLHHDLKISLASALRTLIKKVPVIINPEKKTLIKAIDVQLIAVMKRESKMGAEMAAASITAGRAPLIKIISEFISHEPSLLVTEKPALIKTVSQLLTNAPAIDLAEKEKLIAAIEELIMPLPEAPNHEEVTAMNLAHKSYVPTLTNTFAVRTNPLSVAWYDTHNKKYAVDLAQYPALNDWIMANKDHIEANEELKSHLRNLGFRNDVDQAKQQNVQNILKKPPTLIITDDLPNLPKFQLRNNTYYLTRELKEGKRQWALYYRQNRVDTRLNNEQWHFNTRLLDALNPFEQQGLSELRKQGRVVAEIQGILADHERVSAICQQNDSFSVDQTNIYLPDSFVVSKKANDWSIHYVNADFKAELVTNEQVSGLQELMKQSQEIELSPDTLYQLGILLTKYSHAKSANNEKEKKVGKVLQDDDFSAINYSGQYQADSFVISCQKNELNEYHWNVYCIDVVNRVSCIDPEQIAGLTQLLAKYPIQSKLDIEQLRTLDMAFAGYVPKGKGKLNSNSQYTEIGGKLNDVLLKNLTVRYKQDNDFCPENYEGNKKADSFVIAKQSGQWHLYYIDSLQKVKRVDLATIKGLPELTESWSTIDKLEDYHLRKLNITVGSYIPISKLSSSSNYAKVALLLSNVIADKKQKIAGSQTEEKSVLPESSENQSDEAPVEVKKRPPRLEASRINVIGTLFAHGNPAPSASSPTETTSAVP